MPSFVGLYYPFLHFKGADWLKLSALYWNEMVRMVPPGIEPSEDNDDIKALQDARYIRNEIPSREPLEQVGTTFVDLLATHGTSLQTEYSLHLREGWPATWGFEHRPPDGDKRLGFVYGLKIPDEKRDAVNATGLLELNDGPWAGMHPRLYSVFMTALADQMAPGIGARAVTDEPIDHVAVSGLKMDRLAGLLLTNRPPQLWARPPSEDELEFTMATIAVSMVLPANPQNISVDKILQFRQHYAEERSKFQEKISDLVKKMDYLKKIDSKEVLKRHLEQSYATELRGPLERLNRLMRLHMGDVVETAFSTSFALPAGIGAGLAALGITVAGPVGVGAGLAFGAWQLVRKYRKGVNDALKPSAEAYLYQLGGLRTESAVESLLGAV